MATDAVYPHLSKRADGSMRLTENPRFSVLLLVSCHIHWGWSAEEIVSKYPELTLAEVHMSLAYYFDHQDEMDQEFAAEQVEYSKAMEAQKSNPLFQRIKRLQEQQTRQRLA